MSEHKPVFLNEVLEVFSQATPPILRYWDGTFGRGGHTQAVLQAYPESSAWAFDWDHQAIEHAKQNLAPLISTGRLNVLHLSYGDFLSAYELNSEFPKDFNLMLLDLGVSSPQLDQAERGFSFMQDGPLDMRMDLRQEVTAADIVNGWSEDELIELFKEMGEVQRPFRVVRAIVHDRKSQPYTTTRQLASLIERVDGWQKRGQHPATKYFMALRLQVNFELTNIQEILPVLVEHLAQGGVLAVITFHSLEDRIVKNVFRSMLEKGSLINRKVIKPSDAEMEENPRSRSAKLRAFQKGVFHKRNKYEQTDDN